MSNTLRFYIDEHANHKGDHTYLIDPHDDTQVTFKDVQLKTHQIAQYLTSLGYKAHSSIAFASHNSSRLIQTILGILYGGFRAVSINLVAGQQVISYVLQHSDCQLVICDHTHYAMMQDIISQENLNIKLITIDDLFFASTNLTHQPLLPITEHDDGLLIYTSGTTGQPKGVMLSHKNLIMGGNNTINAHQLTSNDRALCSLPLYHINAFCVSMMTCLLSAQTMVVPYKFSTKNFWSIIHQYRCTWFSLVPTQITYILHHESYKDFDINLSASIRFGRSASSALAPILQSDFEKKFQVYIIETMGLSETSAQITSNPLPPAKRKIGSPGIAYGNAIKIINQHLETLPPNEIGEIAIKGDNVMQYYYKNPEATKNTFTGDGWLRTGDLGKIDEEGYLFVTGRLKELIIKGGENIVPREIDEALYQHPHVIEAASFACPCESYGQDIEACVVIEHGQKTIIYDELIDLCHKILGTFKTPKHIHFIDECPKGPSGKIQRLKLYDMIYKK